MAPTRAEYTPAKACGDCHATLPADAPPTRRLCERCRHRRRALTFVRQAIAHADLAGRPLEVGALEATAGRLELVR